MRTVENDVNKLRKHCTTFISCSQPEFRCQETMAVQQWIGTSFFRRLPNYELSDASFPAQTKIASPTVNREKSESISELESKLWGMDRSCTQPLPRSQV